ncbi:MAG TPA: PEP-CTERM sorting domain-containing protein [Gemmataceae bacterium]|nr:PEP-CTERM sorting domain-containing protein [Gemmataceae bacterium]
MRSQKEKMCWVALFSAMAFGMSSSAKAVSVDYSAGSDGSTSATGSLFAAESASSSGSTGASVTSAAGGGSASLTGGSTPAVATVGTAGDGRPDVIYDPATGDLQIRADGVNGINSLAFFSDAGKFNGTTPTFPGTSAQATSNDAFSIVRSAFSPTLGPTDVFDLGNVYTAGTPVQTALNDLELDGNKTGGPAFFYDLVQAPEPGSFGLLGLGAIGLLARRRRD